MTTLPDVTIIGGGIIGLLTARTLINEGATVRLIDKNQIAQESSWAGSGILLPLYPWRQSEAVNQLVQASLPLYPILCNELFADTNIDPEWTASGLLITKIADINTATHWCGSHNIHAESPPASLYTPLNTTVSNPLWLPNVAQARNPRLVKSLKQDLLNKGVEIIENCKLNSIKLQNQQVQAINTSHGSYSTKQLVIATGAWTSLVFEELLPSYLTCRPHIAPAKGQIVVFQAPPETLPFIVLDGEQYLIPRRDGKILVGSTVEYVGFDKTPQAETREQLNYFACQLLPALKNYPIIHHWAGLRPGTEHGIPYIGVHPEIENLYINAGHFRYGLVMAPASTRLLVDLMLNRSPLIDPRPYQLNSVH
ncbi:MAG: glycine oxidase ThiO [Methylococcaceae bacterium]|jgi:glycine oxidase